MNQLPSPAWANARRVFRLWKRGSTEDPEDGMGALWHAAARQQWRNPGGPSTVGRFLLSMRPTWGLAGTGILTSITSIPGLPVVVAKQ